MSGCQCNSVKHPGQISTKLYRDIPWILILHVNRLFNITDFRQS